MNHKARLRATLAGQPVDRIAVSTWGHDFLREWSATDLAAQTIERQRTCDYDFVKLNPRWTMFAEPWGNRYDPPDQQKFPRLLHKIVNSATDIGAIGQVSADHPVFVEHETAVAKVADALDVDVLATVFSPLSVLGLLSGGVGEPLLTFADEEPALVRDALTHITETLAEHTRRLIARGACGVFYAPLQWTSLDVCPADRYEALARTDDLIVLGAVQHADFNMLHVCGNHIAIDRFLDYPVHAFNWDNFGEGNPSLVEVHGKTDKVVAGGVPHRKLHKLSPAKLNDAVREAVAGLPDRVMLTGGCGIGALINNHTRQEITRVAERISLTQ